MAALAVALAVALASWYPQPAIAADVNASAALAQTSGATASTNVSGAAAAARAAGPAGTTNVLVAGATDEQTAASTANAALAVAEPVVKGAAVQGRAYVQYQGWKSWAKSGKTVGTTSARGLRSLKLKLTGLSKDLSGSINYRVYDRQRGWKPAVADGKTAGALDVPIQAVKIWLTGGIAKHYDVLYRIRLKDGGWSAWAKNKETVGAAKTETWATAVQVKLSPKTEEAAGKAASKTGVLYQTRLASSGWRAWVADGKTAGVTKASAKGQVTDGFVLSLDRGALKGSIEYRAYVQGKKWSQGWKKSGKLAGVAGKRIEALQIRLTGAVAQVYDVYYRTYVYGYGWLDWARNKATSGSTGMKLPIASVQVKLVKKGAAAPGDTAGPTVNKKFGHLDGIDISSHQAGIDVAKVPGDFVIVKATGGKGYTNPFFKVMANATLKAGKLLGIYHYARERGCSGTAVQEADYFVKAAGGYVGRAVLVLDWEADALLLGPSWAKKFLDRVYQKTGVRPLIYMSASPTQEYDWSGVAKNYKLWVAQYPFAYQGGTGYAINPRSTWEDFGAWDAPTIYQYTSTRKLSGYEYVLDLDAFYGKKADWQALAKAQK